ncbi:MAG TPA: hypothetical protein VGG19_02990 [Tepidisphaeraceae bacterium]
MTISADVDAIARCSTGWRAPSLIRAIHTVDASIRSPATFIFINNQAAARRRGNHNHFQEKTMKKQKTPKKHNRDAAQVHVNADKKGKEIHLGHIIRDEQFLGRVVAVHGGVLLFVPNKGQGCGEATIFAHCRECVIIKPESLNLDRLGREIHVGDIVRDDVCDEEFGQVGRVIALHRGQLIFRVFGDDGNFSRAWNCDQCTLMFEDKNPEPVSVALPAAV